MKKKITALAISHVAFITAAYSGFLLFFQSNSQDATGTSTSQQTSSSTATASTASTSAASSSAASSSSATSTRSLTDGTYTGAVTSTNRGDYQVQITVSGGVMTDITILEYPSDNPTSESINADALPTYEAEALESQSADVNAISGATTEAALIYGDRFEKWSQEREQFKVYRKIGPFEEKEILSSLPNDLTGLTVLVSGPPAMARYWMKNLQKNGVPKGQIFYEEFGW
ncbi:hypothetical protein JNG37_08930 [Streptococcus suis]|nr:hypothetical protein [Streptococcus suis]